MKFLAVVVLLFSMSSQADIMLGLTGKYGANGFDAEGTTSSSTSSIINHHRSRTYTLTNGSLDIDNRYQFVPGLMLQTMPEKKYDFSLGVGAYLDATLNVFLGIRL